MPILAHWDRHWVVWIVMHVDKKKFVGAYLYILHTPATARKFNLQHIVLHAVCFLAAEILSGSCTKLVSMYFVHNIMLLLARLVYVKSFMIACNLSICAWYIVPRCESPRGVIRVRGESFMPRQKSSGSHSHLGLSDRESFTPRYQWPGVTYNGSHSRLSISVLFPISYIFQLLHFL